MPSALEARPPGFPSRKRLRVWVKGPLGTVGLPGLPSLKRLRRIFQEVASHQTKLQLEAVCGCRVKVEFDLRMS